jgi:hypothetical protein
MGVEFLLIFRCDAIEEAVRFRGVRCFREVCCARHADVGFGGGSSRNNPFEESKIEFLLRNTRKPQKTDQQHFAAWV